MSKQTDVGRSWRSWAKHDLMSSFAGQEVGSGGRITSIRRHMWFDLSAGDAAEVDGVAWDRGCSPAILARHASKAIKNTQIRLYEIQPNTYDRLVSNLDAKLPDMGWIRIGEGFWLYGEKATIMALNTSGHSAEVGHVENGDAVMVFNDPNAITEWAMRNTFAREVAARTGWFRSLSTMGCNPAGLKRLDVEERLAWFDLVGAQEAALPGYRDLLLAAIERDDAQWAYLLSTSEKWRSSTEAVVQTAFRRIGRTAAMAWYRKNREEFEEAKRVLFLTKKERGDAA